MPQPDLERLTVKHAHAVPIAGPLEQHLTSDGVVLIKATLPKSVCSHAMQYCKQRRASFCFSRATSESAPPCSARALWVDEAMLDMRGRGAKALQRALESNRTAAIAGLVALGYGSGSVQQLSCPMVSLGTEGSTLVERFHLGVHGPAAGKALLCAVIYLDEGSVAACVLPPSEAAAVPYRAEPTHSPRKRRLDESCTCVSPAAGQAVVLTSTAARSFCGNRVALTTWWGTRVGDPTGLVRGAESSARRAIATPPRVFDGVLDEPTRAL